MTVFLRTDNRHHRFTYVGEAHWIALHAIITKLAPWIEGSNIVKPAVDQFAEKHDAALKQYEADMKAWKQHNDSRTLWERLHGRRAIPEPKKPYFYPTDDPEFYYLSQDIAHLAKLCASLKRAETHRDLFVFEDETNLIQRALDFLEKPPVVP